MKKIIFALFLITHGQLFANQTPVDYPSDNRLKMVTYQSDNVFPIHGITLTTTQIIFGEHETVLNVEGGDTAGWIATFHKNTPNMVFIKPTLFDSDSNITVVTDKRSYYFHVTSNKKLEKKPEKPTYVIKFVYPEEARKKLHEKIKAHAEQKALLNGREKDGKEYHWSYTFHGNRTLMPLRAFDDGTFTYFELKKDQPVPAVFIVDNPQGKESLANTRQQGDYLVVLRTAPQFTLRNGEHAIGSIFNQTQIADMRKG